MTAHNFVKNLNPTNDTSEHALCGLTAFNMGNATRSGKHQDCLSIVSILRQELYETATSCERVTKQNLQGVRKHLDFFCESRTKKI